MSINNPGLYNAIIYGVSGGCQERWLTKSLSSDYTIFKNAVIAVAISVDSAIAIIPNGPNIGQINLMQSICQ